MAESYDAQLIQKQFEEMNTVLMRAMAYTARTPDSQNSVVLRDLNQVSNSIASLKKGVAGYLETYQKQVGALVSFRAPIERRREIVSEIRRGTSCPLALA